MRHNTIYSRQITVFNQSYNKLFISLYSFSYVFSLHHTETVVPGRSNTTVLLVVIIVVTLLAAASSIIGLKYLAKSPTMSQSEEKQKSGKKGKNGGKQKRRHKRHSISTVGMDEGADVVKGAESKGAQKKRRHHNKRSRSRSRKLKRRHREEKVPERTALRLLEV